MYPSKSIVGKSCHLLRLQLGGTRSGEGEREVSRSGAFFCEDFSNFGFYGYYSPENHLTTRLLVGRSNQFLQVPLLGFKELDIEHWTAFHVPLWKWNMQLQADFEMPHHQETESLLFQQPAISPRKPPKNFQKTTTISNESEVLLVTPSQKWSGTATCRLGELRKYPKLWHCDAAASAGLERLDETNGGADEGCESWPQVTTNISAAPASDAAWSSS